MDPTLLLPITVEHTIDERSPLQGHTQQSLAVRAASAPGAHSGVALTPLNSVLEALA